MIKKLKEKLNKKSFARHLTFALVSVLFFIGYAIFTDNHNASLRGKIIFSLSVYVVVLIAVSVIWSAVEQKIAKKRGAEIEPILGNMTLDIMPRLYMPVIISDMAGKIIWFNKAFCTLSGSKNAYFGKYIDQICPITVQDILTAGDDSDGIETVAFDNFFKVKGYVVHTPTKTYCISVWNNQNALNSAYEKLKNENPVVAYIMIDNLDELLQHVQEKYREVSNDVATLLNDWAESAGGILKEYQRDKYVFIFREKHLADFVASKFSILDKIRDVRVGTGSLPVTISIGMSYSGETLAERSKDAQAALDMALQRGGDQAVIKTQNEMSFYGGKTQSVQKRTKVRSRVMANELISLMADSSNVLIMGHKNPDFDCFGACVGIARMAMFCGTPVNIIVDTKDSNLAKCFDHLKTLSEYKNVFLDAHTALDYINHDTLLVIADVNNPRQFEAPEIAENVDRIVYIDHHRKTAEFNVKPKIAYIEPSASSASELIAEFLEQTLSSGLLPHEEANLLLAGIMLDTKHFAKNTGVRTYSAGYYLQNEGANPQIIQEFFKADLGDLKREARFESNVKIYRDIFAITTNALKETENSDSGDRIAAAKAADKLLTIDNVLASFAICRIDDTVHISARSGGKVNVQVILEALGGGGHFDAAATQLKDISVNDALVMLKEAIDAYVENNN